MANVLGMDDTGEEHPAGARMISQDSSLLAAIRAGDEDALARLYDRYSAVVYSVAVRVLNDAAAAASWPRSQGFRHYYRGRAWLIHTHHAYRPDGTGAIAASKRMDSLATCG